ncbi:MAG: TetR/AcrR family transcriptional regulator [Planctomycetota bacterium]
MARPREFDEAEVLDRAMLQFWRHGYEGTSVHDLVAATGLGRQSLYNTFGDKQALFLAALERYDAKARDMLKPLLREDAGLAELRGYVDAAIALQKTSRCRGCLVVRSALELGAADRRVRAAVRRTAQRVRDGLRHAVAGAVARGEIVTRRAPEELADYLFTTLNGLAGLAGTGADEAQARRVVDLMFESLGQAG